MASQPLRAETLPALECAGRVRLVVEGESRSGHGALVSSDAAAPRPALALVSPAPAPAAPDEARLLALVARVRDDDLAAFEELYRLTRADAARILFHLAGRRGDIEDLLQETYLQLLKAVKRFRGDSRFRTFLFRICANVALMHLRWRRRRPEEPSADPIGHDRAGTSDPEAEAMRREAARLVEKALEVLSPKKRVVFVYHELCGMGPEEIAQIVGSSPNTVRSRLHHARLEFEAEMSRLLERPRAGGRHEMR